MSPSSHGNSSRWEPPDAAALGAEMPGYEVLSLLGRGGMGAVYKARQTNLDRLVAIKILPVSLEGDSEMGFVERFRQEARSMARLSHPAIIAVHDFGQTPSGLLYFAMEFVEGMDIQQYIRAHGGKLAQENALAICAHVLDALAYAHARGIVHRDIKPANVLIDHEGRVRVADFGLAKRLAPEGEESTAFQTLTGYALGTPAYMAPECLDPDIPQDHRADLYAVGVMLFQMLTGKMPQGRFKMPAEENPLIDPRFDELLERALEPDPGYRIQEASEFRLGLDAILSQPVAKPEEQSKVVPMTVAREAKGEVEAEVGAESGANAAARAESGKARPRRAAGTRQRRARVPRKGAPVGWIAGILVAAAVVAGLLAVFSGGGKGNVDLGTERTSLAGASVGSGTAAAPPNAPAAPGPAEASKERPFENSLEMKFVPVPGTDVLFCIHETRWRDYAAFAEETEGVAPHWRNQTHDGFVIEDSPEDHPVVYVSWEDAQAFCKWLSEKEGKTYRLPTDQEWSIAAGIGEEEDWKPDTTPETVFKPEGIFPWGKEWPPPAGAGNYSDESRKTKAPRADVQYLDGFDDGFPTTAPVMSFEPNKIGLYDLGGNAWEWCEDGFNSTTEHYVLRGGSWTHYGHSTLLSSRRGRNVPGYRDRNFGFRVVLEVATKSASPSAHRPSVPEADLSRAIALQRPAWPADDSRFASAGRFRAWSSDPSDTLLQDLDRLAGVDDVVQVQVQGSGVNSWIALRRNGETVSRSRRADEKEIVRISRGARDWISLIDREGRVRVYNGGGRVNDEAFADLPRVKDLYASPLYRVALLDDGTLQIWEDAREEGGEDRPQWLALTLPPGRKALAISSSINFTVALLDNGGVSARGRVHGQRGLPTEFGPGSTESVSFSSSILFSVEKGTGEILSWNAAGGELRRLGKTSGKPTLLDAQHAVFLLDSDGGIISDPLSGEAGDLFAEPLSRVRNAKEGLISLYLDIVEDQPPVARLLWYDDKDDSEQEPATSSSSASPQPAEASKDSPFVNTLGMKFVPVPGTDVLFCIHETRWRDYAAFAEENPGTDEEWRKQTHLGFEIADRPEDHPVVLVSWEDAKAFCAWLSRKEGKHYRLPTDREWSIAVGIGEEEGWEPGASPASRHRKLPDRYPWGTAWPPPPGAGNYGDRSSAALAPMEGALYLEGYDDGFPTTAPVMSFPPNSFGLFDMGGNGWEWVEDLFHPESENRLARGASWMGVGRGDLDYRTILLSSFRRSMTRDHRTSVCGFRIVLAPSESSATSREETN